MPYGTVTCVGVRWNSRRPGRAVRRSITAAMSPAAMRLSAPDDPRTRTSTVSGRLPTISRPLRQVLELDRRAQHALDHALAGDDQPQQRGDADRQELQPEVAEGMVRHQLSEYPAGRGGHGGGAAG